MIIITGAAGFIGSNMVAKLNQERFRDIVVVDDFSRPDKMKNLEGKQFSHQVHRDDFVEWLKDHNRMVQFVVHLGARTDTAEFRWEVFERLNLGYSKRVWNACVEFGLPLIYASSAATYGSGEMGYLDEHSLVPSFEPLNPYGKSKNDFDLWALQQPHKPYFWAGLKFFNVYGPNEYHKGRMASVIFHAYQQILETGEIKLFRSHKPGIADGEQKRDFIYVKDALDVIYFLMHHRRDPGIYNLGTGRARTFLTLAQETFRAMNRPENITFIDTPADIREKYQYYTCAEMKKLRSIGYDRDFTLLEDGIRDYVGNYLLSANYH
jgi:ADP-L-glycero-D-manno-heptose 6-epimerase